MSPFGSLALIARLTTCPTVLVCAAGVLTTGGLRAKNRGRVINIASTAGKQGVVLGAPYSASKHGVVGFTKALGNELAPTGITVNALGPTVFRSPLTAWMYEDSERAQTVRKGFLARVPKGRLGEPEDLAGPLLFLASKASDF